jgi:hypothetical protein
MWSSGALLRARRGIDGSFLNWCEKLGLKDFLSSYPLAQLAEWGWLVPQSRIIFPKRFFLEWEEFPCYGTDVPADLEEMHLLWDSMWTVDESEPLWFLDPFFRPGDSVGELLFDHKTPSRLPGLPKTFKHPRGIDVSPYVDYFFHWQAYALIDIIRSAEGFGPILRSPDLKKRLAFIEKCRVKGESYWKPEEILVLPARWGGLREPMTWLSHYRALREAIAWNDSRWDLLRKGANKLAVYLKLTEADLEAAIKDKLLVLAQDWIDANERLCPWTLRAYPHLQRDISYAVEWLCYLSNKTFSDYLELWQYEGYMGRRRWAELHKVLEYEFFADRKYFLKMVPEYFKMHQSFQETLEFESEDLKMVVARLQTSNYPFGSFLAAFRQLHGELSYRMERDGRQDFRDLRPLDYFSLLAIRAEGCLRYAIERSGELGECHKLNEYVKLLARKKEVSNEALSCYKQQLPRTRLHETPDDPVAGIMSLVTDLPSRENGLVQAFLCCELARNYFAHHHYLDEKLTRSKEAGFMMTGIVVTVLFLLPVDLARH